MTDTRHQRFEIDLDDIERQLRRAVEPVPTSRPDPLAELARIVGQDDPFRDIFGAAPSSSARPSAPPAAASSAPVPAAAQVQPAPTRVEPTLSVEDRGVLALRPEPSFAPAAPPAAAPDAGEPIEPVAASAFEPRGPEPRLEEPVEAGLAPAEPARPVFDPVADAYGSAENAVDAEDFQPLRPHRSRRRLVAVAAVVGVALAGTAGALMLRGGGSGGGLMSSNGAPPVVSADTSPLKVVPENPGGVEIPNQDRQIYDRGAAETKSRLVDRQEQPIDVREAARALPPAPQATPDSQAQTPSTAGLQPTGLQAAGIQPTPLSSVTSALGAPRRVRTVVVHPDGTPFGTGAVAADTPALNLPPSALPTPVAVPTVSVPVGGTAVPTSAQQAALPPADAPAASVSSGQPPVTVLPPARPRLDTRASAASPKPEPVAARDMAGSSESGMDPAPVQIGPRPQRNAARVAAAPQPAVSPDQAPVSGGSYVVNLATRSSEAAARAYSGTLSTKYASDFGGRRASVVREDADGKTGYRVRVGPVSRDEANGICDRVKSAGGSCSVASGN